MMKSNTLAIDRAAGSLRAAADSGRSAAWHERLARRAVLDRLARIDQGALTFVDGDHRHQFGDPSGGALAVTLTVHDPAFYPALAFGGSVGAGESYMDGHWSCDDLAGLVRLFVVNRPVLDALEGRATWLKTALGRLAQALHRNTRSGSRRNIEAHYDLGNEMFKLFLDESMTYSAGVFPHPESTLAEAQEAKYDRLCRKLDLQPTDHVVEIGTGWGGFAIHAATHFGCRVTTTTISPSQHDEARRRIDAAGLADRITLLQRDYRDLDGRFDKLVSIEMIEAVGHHYFKTFFAACARLLKPDGIAALQAITINDQQFDNAVGSVDFIQRYLYPGSNLPSITEICKAATAAGDLRLYHFEELNPHYARTLRLWRERFMARLDAVRALGYDDRFIRMWEFYLAYCEGGFLERWIGSVQLVLTKPQARPVAIAPALR
jgi:cyclopropane-fatty-acyl-phospholipid synthase